MWGFFSKKSEEEKEKEKKKESESISFIEMAASAIVFVAILPFCFRRFINGS